MRWPFVAISLLACGTAQDPDRTRPERGAPACATDDECRARGSAKSCEHTRDCSLDLTTARCEPGAGSAAALRNDDSGPMCACDERDHRCHVYSFDPVPCRSADDCWVEDAPVPHAIARPPRLRGRAFRGCVDGERVPACVARHCTLRASPADHDDAGARRSRHRRWQNVSTAHVGAVPSAWVCAR